MSKRLSGVVVSEGIAIGTLFSYKLNSNSFENKRYASEGGGDELQLWESAVKDVTDMIEVKIGDHMFLNHTEAADILNAHLSLLNDTGLTNEIKNLIKDKGYSATYALGHLRKRYAKLFSKDASTKEKIC